MKIQMQEQSLRLRIDEAELARLRADGWIESRTRLGDGIEFAQRIELGDDTQWLASPLHCCLRLARAQLDVYIARLPCRDGLEWAFSLPSGATLALTFEVDVRDSVRERGPRRRVKSE